MISLHLFSLDKRSIIECFSFIYFYNFKIYFYFKLHQEIQDNNGPVFATCTRRLNILIALSNIKFVIVSSNIRLNINLIFTGLKNIRSNFKSILTLKNRLEFINVAFRLQPFNIFAVSSSAELLISTQ